MGTMRGSWSVAGLAAGAAGLATSYATANVMAVRSSPVVAVAELIIEITPGRVIEESIAVLGFQDKTVLVAGIFVFLALAFAWAGRLAARRWWAPVAVFACLAAIGVVATAVTEAPATAAYLPLAVGLVTWVVVLSLLAERLHRPARTGSESSRRGFLLGAGAVAVVAVGVAVLGRVWGSGRRGVEEARRLLRITGVTEPRVPESTRVGVPGVTPWATPAEDFYLIHTAIALPTIAPDEWWLRIHGLVEREVTISYADLIARERSEAWITLNCVSNPVGGDLIGNAWWSGVRLADLLAEAGPLAEADAVLQTSEDGWTCGTPLAALTDERDAMLAVAMNGRPLRVEHGFPVRTIVPGLYGFVSACKWVVDLEVTRFDRISAYWTGKGWAEQAPVRLASRIDVPRDGVDVEAGELPVGGVAWHQQTGIEGVEVSLDGGPWQPVEVAGSPSDDTWVQWGGRVTVDRGDHELRVRAVSKAGEVQTGVEREVVPDGATGWHTVRFSAG
ncbi:molybdopterin-dependent oxidoreductase [Nocardioides coralli]|uniref:molybdopterin-dependent oxidoreductase n=1 Tax=Nocardioides coralli TaxID=2872154 RepID=UPI001CA3A79B|nr:molybdopterin-dependent oxidoreductase [Nocardioides coralli]QZY28731.1 molybdopterin-dependent oxidoreductase [Nocardioides coralli]